MFRLQREKLNKDQLSEVVVASPGVVEILTPEAASKSDTGLLKVVLGVFSAVELVVIVRSAVMNQSFDWGHVAVWLVVIPLLAFAFVKLSYIHHFRITGDGIEIVRQSFLGKYRKFLTHDHLQFLLFSPIGEDRFAIYIHPGVGQPIATLTESQCDELVGMSKRLLQIPAHIAAFELIETSRLGQVLSLYRGKDFLREVMNLHRVRLFNEDGLAIARIPSHRQATSGQMQERPPKCATSTFDQVDSITVEGRDDGEKVQINEDEVGYRYSFFLRFKFRNRDTFDTGTFLSIEKSNSESITAKSEADWVANYYRRLVSATCKKP